MSQGKTVGYIVIFIGVGICVLATLFIGSGYVTRSTSLSGAILGISLFGAMPLLLTVGAGVYLIIKGGTEARQLEQVKKKERILGMIQAQGQVSLSSIMVEMGLSREEVSTAIYDLVNLGLFTGYIDWDSMTFYSQDAPKIASNKCPNCGGIREFVGKGVIKCPYCGVSLFIPPGTPDTQAAPQPPPDSPQ
ncbi:MAG: zinc ribbon domain-containing protein [Chloroflexota bacterium]